MSKSTTLWIIVVILLLALVGFSFLIAAIALFIRIGFIIVLIVLFFYLKGKFFKNKKETQ